ncbi:PQQ-binding-like beta-propeller repeat protein [Nakamurella sp. UYEF19]|uniref:outer membrane protein assembly factor BamB family protein n=1 Tax=Nakamurella sp. UYEF19 TaxID=1756392 RepID=UPI00339864A1
MALVLAACTSVGGRPVLPGPTGPAQSTTAQTDLSASNIPSTARTSTASTSTTSRSTTPTSGTPTTTSPPLGTSSGQGDDSSVQALPPGATTAAPPTLGPADKGKALMWTQADFTPLGQPVAVGPRVVVYGLKAGVLSIEVLDAGTGRVVWSRPASPGDAAPGVNLDPTVIGGTVVYLRPASTSSLDDVRVVAADPATGKDIAVTPVVLEVGERPEDCGNLACFTVVGVSGVHGVRMDVHTGKLTPDPARLALAARTIGPEGLLSIQEDGKPEQLARQVGTKIAWTTPLSAIFGAGYSTNFGWEFHAFDQQKVLVGTVGADQSVERAKGAVPLGVGSEMAGINVTTGARLWLQTGGVDYFCLAPDVFTGPSSLEAVRCRWAASSKVVLNGSTTTIENATVSLEGFDPATGRTTWSVALKNPSGTSYQDWTQSFEVVGEDSLVANGPSGPVLIDTDSGATTTVKAGTQATCTRQIITAIVGGNHRIEGKSSNSYITGNAVFSCRPNGTASALTGRWPSWAGAVTGHVHVVTTNAGVQGYRTG